MTPRRIGFGEELHGANKTALSSPNDPGVAELPILLPPAPGKQIQTMHPLCLGIALLCRQAKPVCRGFHLIAQMPVVIGLAQFELGRGSLRDGHQLP